MARIFLSYRRQDASGHARHLFEHLAALYGKKSVFMDVATIAGGEDFVARIDREVGRSDAFIALIGPRWLDARDGAGERRLDREDDYVRHEVAASLRRGAKTIPVLVDGAAMPRPEELPEEIAELASRNAVELTSGRWDYELQKLLDLLPPPPRRWIWRTAAALTVALVLVASAFAVQRWLRPSRMTGIFNVAVLDFGERATVDGEIRASPEGRGIADQIYEDLRTLADGQGRSRVVEVGRFQRLPKGKNPAALDASLAALADQVDATLVVHGVLELDAPPYRFTPLLYLSQRFNGGEELTGDAAFGKPIEVALPLDRLALAEDLRARLEALGLFTLGLGYLQIDRAAPALELFDSALRVEDWDTGREVVQLFRGSALVELERYPEAYDAYSESLSLAGGEYDRALIGLGNVFYDKSGSIDRAVDYYRRALAAARQSPAAHAEAKARYNLGLALARRAHALGETCTAEDARAALRDVVEAQEAEPDVEVLRMLAFKSNYQLGLLARECTETGGAERFEVAIRYLHAASDLGEPLPIRRRSWFDLGSAATDKVEERPWQRDRWGAWLELGYCQLRLAELGRPELYPEAVESFERVVVRYQRKLGDIGSSEAAEAYQYLARAYEPSDPSKAEEAAREAERLRSTN